ncbi:Gfo/Idh/MocA family protein [Aquimarina aquimarini]|uniref:Gfo/Idh/MocA family protein n=1 Tax=Aquimarina aquimarini TaxID=1191734 RepID=UPI000D55E7AE|nr:Gfo/Idh/MocA family oxidoreductase [Aquimarina aquimarini]
MTKIKLGIIGYGSWVKDAYIPALRRDGRAEIVAISARSEATIQMIRADFGDTIDIYRGYKDLLDSIKIEAVMIAVPDEVHANAIIAGVNSAKAIFYEPPIAHTRVLIPEVLKELLAAQQITHADLELALVPAISMASELIKKQTIGNVQTASIRLQSNWGRDSNQDTNTINRLSVWYVHVLNVLLDSSPKRVLLMDGYGTQGRRQSQSTCFFDYNGVWGEFKVNIDSVEVLTIKIEVVGDNGDMHIDVLTGELKTRTKRNPIWDIRLLPAIQPYADWPGMHESISSFLDAVESGIPSYANAIEVANLQCIGLASEESKETGTWAIVKPVTEI